MSISICSICSLGEKGGGKETERSARQRNNKQQQVEPGGTLAKKIQFFELLDVILDLFKPLLGPQGLQGVPGVVHIRDSHPLDLKFKRLLLGICEVEGKN